MSTRQLVTTPLLLRSQSGTYDFEFSFIDMRLGQVGEGNLSFVTWFIAKLMTSINLLSVARWREGHRFQVSSSPSPRLGGRSA